MGSGAETKKLILEDHKGCIRRCEEFGDFEGKIDKEDSQENHIKNRINKVIATKATPNVAVEHGLLYRQRK